MSSSMVGKKHKGASINPIYIAMLRCSQKIPADFIGAILNWISGFSQSLRFQFEAR